MGWSEQEHSPLTPTQGQGTGWCLHPPPFSKVWSYVYASQLRRVETCCTVENARVILGGGDHR